MRKYSLLLATASMLFFSAMAQKKNAKVTTTPIVESNTDSVLFSKVKYRLEEAAVVLLLVVIKTK
jgi:hypothetical protein